MKAQQDVSVSTWNFDWKRNCPRADNADRHRRSIARCWLFAFGTNGHSWISLLTWKDRSKQNMTILHWLPSQDDKTNLRNVAYLFAYNAKRKATTNTSLWKPIFLLWVPFLCWIRLYHSTSCISLLRTRSHWVGASNFRESTVLAPARNVWWQLCS